MRKYHVDSHVKNVGMIKLGTIMLVTCERRVNTKVPINIMPLRREKKCVSRVRFCCNNPITGENSVNIKVNR